ncbi:MAG: hypothetical protein GX575_05915 [Candidatus Anammoximicrobium sp.]|nr:hypothetical protein [Candidatus Anammoximicrobium sp.]
MSSAAFTFVLAAIFGATIPEGTVQKHNELFRRFWGTDFVWKFEDLPTSGTVPEYRVPYSGHIYLDRNGGTVNCLRKYDLAFNGGRMLATGYEEWDTTAQARPTPSRGGLLRLRRVMKMETPNWHGHCNGWAAAAIRHAEPQTTVRRNGVSFTPADIKGLLAEVYIYNDLDYLIGQHEAVNAGAFHAAIANWLGRAAHPIGLEADPGEQKWNYPAYGYEMSSSKRSDGAVDVRLDLTYAKDSNGEYQRSPRYSRFKTFRYRLDLNDDGEIVGGVFYANSSMIDMLWLPLRPKQGREAGNEPGNPHLDVDEVLSIWRESVPEELRKKWPVIDPPKEDRILDVSQLTGLVPVQDIAESASSSAAGETGN